VEVESARCVNSRSVCLQRPQTSKNLYLPRQRVTTSERTDASFGRRTQRKTCLLEMPFVVEKSHTDVRRGPYNDHSYNGIRCSTQWRPNLTYCTRRDVNYIGRYTRVPLLWYRWCARRVYTKMINTDVAFWFIYGRPHRGGVFYYFIFLSIHTGRPSPRAVARMTCNNKGPPPSREAYRYCV